MSMTALNPGPTLPAMITSPPTAQFTPGPGCVDPENHWVVVTSCAAIALGEDYGLSPSPDWLTCQLTQFGPPENGPGSCYVPYSAQTVENAQTRFYSGCPVGYTGASTQLYSRSDGRESNVHVLCCPTQYNFNVDGYFTGGYLQFTTERDGVSYDVGYPLPACATSYISELAGKEIAVQTQLNTHGWEKRQIANVPWDYLDGTMYAEVQSYDYTVFHGTHTCYQDCYGWRDYYFSGGVQPPFTVIDTPPVTTTPAEETSLLEGPSSAAGSAGIAETSPMPTGTQASPSPTGEDSSPVVSAVPPTPTPTSGGSDGDVSSPSSSPPLSTSAGESMGTVTVAVPVYLVSLALFMSSMVL